MSDHDLESIVRECLCSFFTDLCSPRYQRYQRREREMISRFCIDHLIPACHRHPGLVPAQIGIEVAVPQLPDKLLSQFDPKVKKPKEDVCKDIVIWPEPEMAAFDPDWRRVHEPLAVIEWTVISHSKGQKAKEDDYEYDQRWLLEKREWLLKKGVEKVAFTGYAVLIDNRSAQKELTCEKVPPDSKKPWLELPGTQ